MNYEGGQAINIKGVTNLLQLYIRSKKEARVDIRPLENDAGNRVSGNGEQRNGR